MNAFVVRPGRALTGHVQVSGAKNSALKLVAAALLAEGRSVVRNVPAIADMAAMGAVLEHLGVTVSRPQPDVMVLDVPAQLGAATPPALVKRLRASIVVLGPLLARNGYARVAMPGGCNLGSRNIDLHLAGLAQLGAEVTYGADYVEARARRLRGAEVELEFASVGATENIMLAAVLAEGVTHIRNAAREPEIADLAAFLAGMGAQIEGAGSPEITVRGVTELAPTEHRVVGDRIEAGTYAVAAAITRGAISLTGVRPDHLRLALEKLRAAGVVVQEGDEQLTIDAREGLRAVDVVTLPYPGFPTDLQAPLLALLSQAGGTSMVTENVYDGRFSVVAELNRMGAEIEIQGHHALVRGPRSLHGARVRATDLRAGAALVLAGLVAHGETEVREAQHVDRGYSDFAGRLRALGADVERVTVPAGEALAVPATMAH
ncbi:MAG: UDP-N-acetylglucosamine 1-carboxyvinyltransferase [Egibacteraceae bacterium]